MTRRSWIFMATAAALWGASYMFIKVALEDVSEGVIVCVRTVLGALVLVPLALRAGALQPLLERRGWTLVLAFFQVVLPFGLITYGERHVESALAGILIASSPIFLALIASRFDHEERSHGWGLVGIVTGMVGVALLFGVDLRGDTNELLGGLMIVGAALSYAIAVLTVKHRFGGVPPVGVAASTMVISAVVWAPAALASLPDQMPAADTTLSLLALGAGGTGVAFLLFYSLIDEIGPARASIIAYIAPAFSVLYGVSILDEQLTLGTIAGLLLILGGSWLGAEGRLPRRLARRARTPEAPVPAESPAT